jgi:hypothetical protein
MSVVEFTFKGMPVGEFEDPGLPSAPGSRRYMPFRGPGHHEMQSALQSGATATCEAVLDDRRVQFVVAACPSYGVLQIDRILSLTRLTGLRSQS